MVLPRVISCFFTALFFTRSEANALVLNEYPSHANKANPSIESLIQKIIAGDSTHHEWVPDARLRSWLPHLENGHGTNGTKCLFLVGLTLIPVTLIELRKIIKQRRIKHV